MDEMLTAAFQLGQKPPDNCTGGAGSFAGGAQLTYRCASLVCLLTRNAQLSLVYFLEYVILPGCAAKVNPGAASSHKWAVKHAYVVLSFCYQFGVLISRSSLSFVRITWVEVLTVLQVRLIE